MANRRKPTILAVNELSDDSRLVLYVKKGRISVQYEWDGGQEARTFGDAGSEGQVAFVENWIRDICKQTGTTYDGIWENNGMSKPLGAWIAETTRKAERRAAIIESPGSICNALGCELQFVAYDVGELSDSYGTMYFDNGATVGTHVDPPENVAPNVVIPSWYGGKEVLSKFIVWPGTWNNILAFLARQAETKAQVDSEDHARNLTAVLRLLEQHIRQLPEFDYPTEDSNDA